MLHWVLRNRTTGGPFQGMILHYSTLSLFLPLPSYSRDLSVIRTLFLHSKTHHNVEEFISPLAKGHTGPTHAQPLPTGISVSIPSNNKPPLTDLHHTFHATAFRWLKFANTHENAISNQSISSPWLVYRGPEILRGQVTIQQKLKNQQPNRGAIGKHVFTAPRIVRDWSWERLVERSLPATSTRDSFMNRTWKYTSIV